MSKEELEFLGEIRMELMLAERVIHSLNVKDLNDYQKELLSTWYEYAIRNIKTRKDN